VSTEPGYSRQSSIRFVFRVAAIAVLALAAYFVVAGLSDLFTAEDEPKRFWMLFVGVPLLAIGGWLALAGFGTAGGSSRGVPCRSCGARTEAGASYCDSCGKPLG
jgi:hypothetical protein